MSTESLKITAVTVAQAAKILATAYNRRITEEQVRKVVDDAEIIRADGTFSLIDYTAFLAKEATRGGTD